MMRLIFEFGIVVGTEFVYLEVDLVDLYHGLAYDAGLVLIHDLINLTMPPPPPLFDG